MAAEDDGKTEDATDRKREEARKEGNVAKSQDLGAATVLFSAVVMLWFLGGWMEKCMTAAMYRFISEDLAFSLPPPDPKGVCGWLYMSIEYIFYAIFPFMIVLFVVAVAVNIYQVGLEVSFKPLTPDFTKLNPVNGAKQLFSKKKIVMLLMNLGKVTMVLLVAWPFLASNFGDSTLLMHLMPAASKVFTADEIWGMAVRIAAVLLILSIVDLFYQRHKHRDTLKMSKDEVKDERRNMEGDPKVKQKRFEKMVELARQRMMQEIPEAEVVVRNPTHFAVALKFKPEMPAPEVVAKGKNKIAEKIIEKAREAGVPTWQEPWLARELYKRCEVGDSIPPELFQAVADILAHVMDKNKRASYQNASGGAA